MTAVVVRARAMRSRARHRGLITVPALLALFVVPRWAPSFELLGSTWPEPATTFEHDIPVAVGQPDWNAAFIEATEAWNRDTPFVFSRVTATADPCEAPGIGRGRRDNGAVFSTTECGDPWGSNTLAIAITWTRDGERIVQSGIVFNANKSWDVFNGGRSGVFDFRRVALHELGHTIGLAHSDISHAIMRPTYSASIETLQTDDIAAVEFVYGDLDGDGILNANDADRDGDGTPNTEDVFPDDPDETADTDGDGVGDNADAFPDDPDETADTDGDGVGDNADAFPEDPARSASSEAVVPIGPAPLAALWLFMTALGWRRTARAQAARPRLLQRFPKRPVPPAK